MVVTDVHTAGRVDCGRLPPDEHKDISVFAIAKIGKECLG